MGVMMNNKKIYQCDFSSNAGTISVCNCIFHREKIENITKFPYKRRYMNRIQSYLSKIDNQIVLTGDFNIAPNANDRAIGEDNEKRWLREGIQRFFQRNLSGFQNLKN